MVSSPRSIAVITLMSVVAATAAPVCEASDSRDSDHALGSNGSSSPTTNHSTVLLPCIPVGVYWEGPESIPGTPPGPQLAVVRIDLRPKDARVYLDGRFIGRARYFNGKKGYLFLEPGTYRLEIKHQGHQAVAVDLEAQKRCRYDLKHRLERGGQGEAADDEKSYGRGRPFDRVFGPR